MSAGTARTATPPRGQAPEPITSHRGTRRGAKKTVKVDDLTTPSALTDSNVYAFVLKPGPFTGKRTFIRLRNPQAIRDNGGNRRLVILNYRYETTSKAIADELAKQITLGSLKDIRREIVVWIPCPVQGCTEKFKSNDSKALSEHFMAAHVSVEDDVSDEVFANDVGEEFDDE